MENYRKRGKKMNAFKKWLEVIPSIVSVLCELIGSVIEAVKGDENELQK